MIPPQDLEALQFKTSLIWIASKVTAETVKLEITQVFGIDKIERRSSDLTVLLKKCANKMLKLECFIIR